MEVPLSMVPIASVKVVRRNLLGYYDEGMKSFISPRDNHPH